MIRRLLALATIGVATFSTSAAQGQCQQVIFDEAPFTTCQVDLSTQQLRLFHLDSEDQPYGTFARVNAGLPEGSRLAFAMNAGMYHSDLSPVGLYIEDGVETRAIVTREGPGNFGLLPNGVFCLQDTSAAVIESRRFAADTPACRDASQSGPMLVIDGALHPRFLEDGTSRHIRNGVGVDDTGQIVYLVISDVRVNFHHFGRFFRDYLGVPNALYFDGRVSRLYAPELGRSGRGVALGPIIGAVVAENADPGS